MNSSKEVSNHHPTQIELQDENVDYKHNGYDNSTSMVTSFWEVINAFIFAEIGQTDKLLASITLIFLHTFTTCIFYQRMTFISWLLKSLSG